LQTSDLEFEFCGDDDISASFRSLPLIAMIRNYIHSFRCNEKALAVAIRHLASYHITPVLSSTASPEKGMRCARLHMLSRNLAEFFHSSLATVHL
jgi:hypothetical protein